MFDSMDKRKMLRAEKRELREELVKKCEKVLRETKWKVRKGEKQREEFWIRKRVRQGYPLSPSLFTFLLAENGKGQEGDKRVDSKIREVFEEGTGDKENQKK